MKKTLDSYLVHRDRPLLARPKPPCYELDDPFCCGCVACGSWRGARVMPGRLCRPATQDPRKTEPGTVPAWDPNEWRAMGWNFRLERNDIDRLLVIGYVSPDDIDNGGHLDSVFVLTQTAHPRLMVTSRKWLVALA